VVKKSGRNVGALKKREWKTREWTSRHEEVRVDMAGVDNMNIKLYFMTVVTVWQQKDRKIVCCVA